ncbi:hypothetical protein AK812_SmicGene31143 [Symbiodinium microadriaticum]|uniref:Uncharacterized protein n=1 Tax=Symbiodinium microadriaticum TaxID=2951 RepID=A0A1Q9CXF4_SYMMI|nr:hypothetical protein AK812_SmicGene31143 [Symbiodinium microadriaticum]CAE7235608.1 unnamed protein product [Symbiodinium microadriaticum]CAE7898793.1 unnamed protein product [Symbiodinium sp. KB8]
MSTSAADDCRIPTAVPSRGTTLIKELCRGLDMAMAKGSRWHDSKGSGKGKGRPPDNYKTDLCRFFERGLCEKGKACPFAHGKEELRPSSLPDNIMANKQKDAEVMSWLKERREEEGDAGEAFEHQWKAWCKVHALQDLSKAARLKSIHDFRAQVESGRAPEGESQEAAQAVALAACPQGHRLKRLCATDEYECDCCGADIRPGSTFFDCRDCDYSLCVACSAQSTTRERPAEVPDKRQLHATAEPSPPEAPVEPVTDEPAHNTNAAATTVWASSIGAIRFKLKHAIEDGLKLGDLIGLTTQQSPLKCPELVRECEGRCAGFIGHFLFPEALPTVVQTCLGEQNLAGVCRALQLEALLQIETDGELASRAAVASSFFLALFRASRRCRDNACLLVAIEAMLDFVCLIGTSHFVAMGVMSADASLQDSQSNGSDGEEVIWASGQLPETANDPQPAEEPQESEEAARARRVQAQQERKSSVRWDYTGGYRAADAKRETNEEATLRLINARCKGMRLGSNDQTFAPAVDEELREPSKPETEPRRGMVQGGESSKAPRFKKDLCKYFERGHCDKGAQCTFAHGYEELRGGNKAAPSNGLPVHHGPSWETGPPLAETVYRKKI